MLHLVLDRISDLNVIVIDIYDILTTLTSRLSRPDHYRRYADEGPLPYCTAGVSNDAPSAAHET